MHTDHVDALIGAYLNDQLSSNLRREVELHLRICPGCARQLVDTQRLHRELRPLMQTALGQPALPPGLRHKVKEAIYHQRTGHPFYLFWIASTRVLNTAGAIAVVLLLTLGLFVLIRTQLPDVNSLSEPVSLSPSTPKPPAEQATPTSLPPATAQPTVALETFQSSLGDTLPTSQPVPQAIMPTESIEEVTEVTPPFMPKKEMEAAPVLPQETPPAETENSPEIPGGTIAFALFNSTPGLERYEIYLISPDGTNRRTLPLTGVSEPALHPYKNDHPLAFRGWGGPAISRQLLTSDLAGNSPQAVSDFWEDSQPDWSPIENRLVFASQRESDRRWRLYTAWGDGSLEVNLRREGKSPTLAQDGQRFAYEGCDDTGNRCGLWWSSLGNSEKEARSFLIDPQAKSPDWSPVSEEIVYMTNINNNWDIYVIDSNGRNMRRLTDDPANDGLPTWSPDGKWIAFVSDRGGRWGIWLLHLDSNQLYLVTTFEEFLSLTPPNRLPLYNEHSERQWWDEQLSWGSLP